MNIMVMTRNKDDAKETRDRLAILLGGTGTVLSIAAIMAALTRPVKAAPLPGEQLPPGEKQPPPAGEVVIDGAIRDALAAMLSLQASTLTSLESVEEQLGATNKILRDISSALGVTPVTPVVERRILEPFLKENQALSSKEQFNIYEASPGKGSLVWAIIDVSDPNTKVSFKFDGLVWDFTLTTLFDEGIQQPLFPGVWLSKYDAASGHYTIIFSAGALEGFSFKEKLLIYITYQGTGSATLNVARGIKWTYL